jgi:CSLREA domain-containing protein
VLWGRRWWHGGIAFLAAFLLSAAGASAATTIRVTTTSDDGAVAGGDCATTDQSCSLREAINTSSAGDTISLPKGDYKLTQTYNLIINHDLTLAGSGARTTTIQQTTSDYVLAVDPGDTVVMKGLTITGGNNTSAFGGGIQNNGGTLTLQDSAVTDNQAAGFNDAFFGGPSFPGLGGGIYSGGGSLTLIRTTVGGNTAFPGDGPFSGPYGAGGGIYSTTPVTVINSTIAGNTSQGGAGGGIYMVGGGSPTLTLANATVARNTASSAQGGNIYLDTSSGAVPSAVKNSIIADGTASAGSENCAGGPLTSKGYNLEDRNECGLHGSGDRHPSDAKLSQLKGNGGSTNTLALLPGSRAINAGNPAGCTDATNVTITSDQRGIPRPQARRCDIGAYEFRVVALAAGPRISGKPRVGRKLTCRIRTQSPDGPATVTVSWRRGARNVASGKTYTVRPADRGHALRCHVVARNAAGRTVGTSQPVSVPPLPTVSIASWNLKGVRAKFKFKTKHATRAQCALLRGQGRPSYSSCTSPKSYHLSKAGSYEFFVRAIGPGGTSAPAKQGFHFVA